jgi:hypothetical protein
MPQEHMIAFALFVIDNIFKRANGDPIQGCRMLSNILYQRLIFNLKYMAWVDFVRISTVSNMKFYLNSGNENRINYAKYLQPLHLLLV